MGLLFSESTEIDNDKEFLVIKEKHPGRFSSLLFGTITLIVLSTLFAWTFPQIARQIATLIILLFLVFMGLLWDYIIENYKFYLGLINGKEIRKKGSPYYNSKGPYEVWIAK